jgi:hypothetical protein
LLPLSDEDAQEGRVYRMITASTEYSLHVKTTPRQPMARPYGRGCDDHLHRALRLTDAGIKDAKD